MVCLSRNLSLYVISLSLAIGLSGANAHGAEATIEMIRKEYATHQGKLRKLSVHWRSNVKILQDASGVYVNRDGRFAIKDDMRFFDVKLRQIQGPPMEEYHLHRAMSYDGQETRILMMADHARIYPTDRREQFDPPDDFLALQGYPKSQYRIWFNSEFVTCDLSKLLQEQDFEIQGSEEIGGTTCLKIAGLAQRIYVDPKRGFAMVRRELLDEDSGLVGVRYLFQDFSEVQTGIWLARKIITETFDGSRPMARTTLKVLEIEIEDVPDALFSLTIDSGTTISDLRHTRRSDDGAWEIVNYRIPANPADLDQVVAAAVKQQEQFGLAAKRGSSVRPVLLAVNLLAIIVICIVMFKRRAKSA